MTNNKQAKFSKSCPIVLDPSWPDLKVVIAQCLAIGVGTSSGQLFPEPRSRPLHKQWIPAEERPPLLRLMRVKYSCLADILVEIIRHLLLSVSMFCLLLFLCLRHGDNGEKQTFVPQSYDFCPVANTVIMAEWLSLS